MTYKSNSQKYADDNGAIYRVKTGHHIICGDALKSTVITTGIASTHEIPQKELLPVLVETCSEPDVGS
jgi:hypothetical protein